MECELQWNLAIPDTVWSVNYSGTSLFRIPCGFERAVLIWGVSKPTVSVNNEWWHVQDGWNLITFTLHMAVPPSIVVMDGLPQLGSQSANYAPSLRLYKPPKVVNRPNGSHASYIIGKSRFLVLIL